MGTTEHRGRRIVASVMKVILAAGAVPAMVALAAGCVGGPRELAPEEEPRVISETAFELDGGAIPTIEIDPMGLAERPVDAILLRAYAESGELVREWQLPGDLRLDLPVDGLEDGHSYRYEIAIRSDGYEYPLADPISVRLSLGLPVFRPREERVLSIDPRPWLRWEPVDETERTAPHGLVRLTVGGDGGTRSIEVSPDRDEYRSEEQLVDPAAIRAGARLRWTVRVVHESGILGQASVPGEVVYDLTAAAPVGLTGIDGATIVERPVLRWTEVSGAERYRFEARPGDSGEVIVVTVDAPRVPLDIEQVEAALQGSERRIIRWRVAAEGPEDIVTAWSRSYTVSYRTLMPAFFPVLPPGTTASIAMGIPAVTEDRVVDGSEPDERPAIDVTLRRPFAMARFELSNQIVAELLTTALSRGFVTEAGGLIRNTTDGRVLVGLEELQFGVQFGLEAIRDEAGELAAVRPRQGYESHPAVGVSWYGAAYLANALSLLEGREPVYAIGENRVDVYPARNGYRLPSEAEWALAAARTSATDPQTVRIQATENRALTVLEQRAANYLRSGDRWEDVNPPYTAAGGPTVPVGAFGITNAAGISDLVGNVWEWCWDWYDPDWYGRDTARTDPAGPGEPVPDRYGRQLRVVRGSAWNTPQSEIRLSNRGAFDPETGSHSIGVRLVYTLR